MFCCSLLKENILVVENVICNTNLAQCHISMEVVHIVALNANRAKQMPRVPMLEELLRTNIVLAFGYVP